MARLSQIITSNVVVLAQSEAGYGNLLRLASRAYFDGPLGDAPRLTVEALAENAEGLIALTGGTTGPLDTALRGGRVELAAGRLAQLKQAFGEDRLYVEILRHGLDDERMVERELIRLADSNGLSIVATNEPFFAKPDDYDAHDALLAIAEGRLVSDERRRKLTPRHGFKTRAEMAKLFHDLPDALSATVEIAMRCTYRVRTRKPILPNFSQIEAQAMADDPNGAPGVFGVASEPEELRARPRPGSNCVWPSTAHARA